MMITVIEKDGGSRIAHIMGAVYSTKDDAENYRRRIADIKGKSAAMANGEEYLNGQSLK